MKRVVDRTTGQHGTVHWTHAAGWFTPDDGERDELGRVIPTMLDEDMDLVDEQDCPGHGDDEDCEADPQNPCANCIAAGDREDVLMGRWSNDA